MVKEEQKGSINKYIIEQMNEKLPLLIKDKIFHYHEENEKKSKKEKIRRKIRSYNAIISEKLIEDLKILQ